MFLVQMMKKTGSLYLDCCNTPFWTIVDPNADFTVDASCDRWIATTMNQNIIASISVDYGVAYFGTSFEIQWSSFKGTGGDEAKMLMCLVSNNPVGTWRTQVFNSAGGMGVFNAIYLGH